MGRISRYGADATVELSDKLLGTDAGGLTKNYTVDSLGTFIAATHGSEGYINIAFNTTTGIITMTEVDGGTDTIDLGIGTGDTPSFAGMNLTGGHLYNSDGVKVFLGDDSDFSIYHQPGTASIDGGTTSVGSWIVSDSGNLLIHQSSPDQDIIFVNDNGSGGNATYMTLDGGAKTVDIKVPLNVTTDADVTGSVKCTQNLRRTVTTASESSGTHTITLVDNDNFNIAVTNAATTIALVVATENIGQSGMITITNPASVGSLSFVALPSYMLTPEGATINFVTTANAVSIISYYVLATDKVLVNYVGNFA